MHKFIHPPKKYRSQRGQAALFAVLTMVILVVIIGVMIGIGEAVTTQMRVQNSADAAAHAGAAVAADCLANIAWTNSAMSEIYYQSLKAAADNVVAQTNTQLYRALSEPYWYPDRVSNGDGGNLPSPTIFAGEWSDLAAISASAPTIYAQAQKLINPDSGVAIADLVKLGIIQRTIAINAPNLIKQQIYHTAQVNFYTDENKDSVDDEVARIGIFPEDFSFYPEGMTYHNIIIERNPDGKNGWRLTSTSDPAYKFLAICESSDVTDQHEIYHWRFELEDGDSTTKIKIRQERYTPPISDSGAGCDRCTKNYSKKSAEYEITVDDYRLIITVYDENNDGVADAIVRNEKGEIKCIEPLANGVIINSVRYQLDGEGFWTQNGVRLNDTTSIEINGVKVPVSMPDNIDGVQLDSQPIRFRVRGMEFIVSGVALRVYLHFFPAGAVRIEPDYVSVRGLSTQNADGRWRNYTDESVGRFFHRLKNTGSEKWLYEMIYLGSYLTDMSWRKMFTYAATRDGVLPANWWYVPTGIGLIGGDPVDDDDDTKILDDQEWYESATGAWSNFPDWTRPPRAPKNSSDLNFGGFMNVDRARPNSVDENDNAFSVTKITPYLPPTYKYTRTVPESLANKIFREVRRVHSNGALGGTMINPLMYFYYPPHTPADEMETQIEVAGNARPGFWFEGGFKRDAQLSNAERLANVVSLEKRLEEIRVGFVDTWTLGDGDFAQTITFPCVAIENGGLWFLQMFDPLGAVPLFHHEPRYYGDLVGLYDNVGQVPNTEGDRKLIAQTPCRVRRNVGDAINGLVAQGKIGADDGDKYASAAMAINLSGVSSGLEATSELFRRPFIVGVHSPATLNWLAPLFGKDRDLLTEKEKSLGMGNPLHITDSNKTPAKKWDAGHFAFAASRLFFSADDGWVTNFSYGNAGKMFNTEFNDGLNIIKQRLSGYQQKWQKSTRNFFEPTWNVALVPFTASVRMDDIYNDAEELTVDDNAASYLFRQLRAVDWRKNLAENAFGNLGDDNRRVDLDTITSPRGNRINFADPKIEDVIKH